MAVTDNFRRFIEKEFFTKNGERPARAVSAAAAYFERMSERLAYTGGKPKPDPEPINAEEFLGEWVKADIKPSGGVLTEDDFIKILRDIRETPPPVGISGLPFEDVMGPLEKLPAKLVVTPKDLLVAELEEVEVYLARITKGMTVHFLISINIDGDGSVNLDLVRKPEFIGMDDPEEYFEERRKIIPVNNDAYRTEWTLNGPVGEFQRRAEEIAGEVRKIAERMLREYTQRLELAAELPPLSDYITPEDGLWLRREPVERR